MKRDMDYVRELLLKIEELNLPRMSDLVATHADQDDVEKLAEHLKMLIDEAGLIEGISAHTLSKMNWLNIRVTWKGHEYLDNIRDPEIWRKTKEGAAKVGDFSVDIIGALAKGLIKKQIEKHTGVELDI